ncbi:hypothetical protein DdX_14131 [Ditylenchus destructor]|uniref:Uncharacterized protein n=1 Tax=Ditylenchus destructor TaxID=166010 RepID=A0AAD4R1Z9_9BILA|nr:hypothetical protein DdX_14131 [Ditylenchus destructor]
MSHLSVPYAQHDMPMPQLQDQYPNQATPPTRPNFLGNGASPIGSVFVHPKVDLDTGLHQPPPYGIKVHHEEPPDGSQTTSPRVVTPTKSETVAPKAVITPPSPSNLAAQPINYIPAVQGRGENLVVIKLCFSCATSVEMTGQIVILMSHLSVPYAQHDMPMPQLQDQYPNQATPPTRPNFLGNGASPIGSVFVHPKVDLDTGLHQPPPYGIKVHHEEPPDGSQTHIPDTILDTPDKPGIVDSLSGPTPVQLSPEMQSANYVAADDGSCNTAKITALNKSYTECCFVTVFGTVALLTIVYGLPPFLKFLKINFDQ